MHVLMINKGSGKALDVNKQELHDDKARVQQCDYHGGDDQLWQIKIVHNFQQQTLSDMDDFTK